jgi:uncharacterized protein (TIGR02145 family)
MEKGTFTDPRDGKAYKTVTIGKQTWMAENLNYEASGSKCYDNEKYGRLYDWETAKKACPSGWHLPSDKEWQELVDFAGGNAIAGKKLKAVSGWSEGGNGIDEFGFSALSGGLGDSGGSFRYVGKCGSWWSATESGAAYAWGQGMGYDGTDVLRGSLGKATLFSVRCVKD